MRIEKIQDNAFMLRGKIKEISDYHDIKALIEKMRKNGINEVYFGIPQAKEISFYILGYWLKLARKNDFKLHLFIESPLLYSNIVKLGFSEFLEVIDGRLEEYIQPI
ncbi:MULTISPECIES: hypothetical protein [Helicobacter]|uniref:STAS domain-containing protein n=1 Tax=Helicobacter ibis TaxID=2962633 RepID=A0ABT4VHU6_9HELI|nr:MULTISPECIES: hypothetical protein [Helicobacter]MDA3967943.1 hypothetical protein [Helicobacter sp. WB40]MDA3969611.1 hypothetical protein [Helicobacter ibis]